MLASTESFLHFSSHLLYSFSVSPLFISYALFLYNSFCNKSPYITAFISLFTSGSVILNPEFFSSPTKLNDITGIFGYPASLRAFLINPM